MNAPLVFAVLFTKGQTPLFNAAMNWLSQTANAALNYGNRNASSPYTNKDLLKGYLGATAVSVGIALYARTLLASTLNSFSGGKLVIANAVIGWLSGSLAGAANVALMRSKEFVEGIQVTDETCEKVYGKSKAAGRKAILLTALSRFILPLPVLFVPAFGTFLLEKAHMWPPGYLGRSFELALCIFSLTLALPMSIAMFKQRASIARDKIESEFRSIMKKQNGAWPVEQFYFNKGL